MIYKDELLKDNHYAIGGKAQGLVKLVKYGLNVPSFFVIAPQEKINENEIKEALKKLGGDLFAVRSSGLHEDGKTKSFAGQNKTIINCTKQEVYAAIKEVRSFYHNNAYSKDKDDIAVIVQVQINGDMSGVLFTQYQDKNHGIIEYVHGAGEKLVSGESTPERFIFDKKSLDVHEFAPLIKSALMLEDQEDYPQDIEWSIKDNVLYFLQMRPLSIVDDELPSLELNGWNYYVYHSFSLLINSIQSVASLKERQATLFGFNIPIYDGLLVNGYEYYSERNDLLVNKLWESLDKGDFFKRYINNICLLMARVNATKKELKELDVSKLSNDNLLSAYKKYIDLYIDSYTPMMMRPDDYLLAKLKEFKTNNLNEMLLSLKDTLYGLEKINFLEAYLNNDYSSYIDKYSFSYNALGYQVHELTKEELKERSKGLTKEKARKELDELRDKKEIEKQNVINLINQIKNPLHRHYIDLMNEFIYLRTFIAENSDSFFYQIRKVILEEIAKRYQLSMRDLLTYRYDEVANIEKQIVESSILLKRRRGELIYFNESGYQTYYGYNTYQILKQLQGSLVLEDSNIIRGDIACAGLVQGKIKIVNSFKDVNKMEEGYIIVTKMTTPEISFAIEKAIGIITDEGGITCHASIIAREYALPCLVGTKVATTVLKDDMEVVLDCINGYIKII